MEKKTLMRRPLIRSTFIASFLILVTIIAIQWPQFANHPPKVANTTNHTAKKTPPNFTESLAKKPPHLPATKTIRAAREKKKLSLLQTHYPNAPIRFQQIEALPIKGQSRRVTVIETQLKHPLVRVVDTLVEDPDTRQQLVVNSIAMAADHVLVEVPQGVEIGSLIEGSGFEIKKQFSFSPNVLVNFPANFEPAQFETLLAEITSRIGNEITVEPDFIVYKSTTPDDPSFENGTQWNFNNFGQSGGTAGADISTTEGWEIRTDASTVLVGVVDTGIRTTHQDLIGNLWNNPAEIPGNGIDDDRNGVIDDIHGFNAIDDNGDPSDFDGHGTHVSGIVGAQGNNDLGVTGVAWDVQLMGLRFLGAQGGFTSDAIEAIDYGRVHGVDILNNSWGGGGFSNTLLNAIQRAEDADILFVVAAGNDSSNNDTSPSFPASYTLDSIVSVASSTRTDALSDFTNFGATSVDLAAPGSTILSTFNASDNNFATLSGTSMASPHVAGAAAILRAEFPDENFAEIKARLLDTVDVIPAFVGTSLTGGRLNLLGALQNQAIPNPGVLAFGQGSTSVVETAGSLAIIVNRNVGTSGAITVNYQANSGSASLGSDFGSSSGTLTWADGDATERIINVPILDDADSEDSEGFTIDLSGPTGEAVLGGGGSIAVTILDDESTLLDGFQFENTNTEGTVNFAFGTPEPFIATGADNSVAWANLIFQNGRLVILVRRFRPDGTLDWERVLDPANSANGGFQPRLAMGPSGEIVVAYGSIVAVTANGSISAIDIATATFDSSGTLLWDEILDDGSTNIDLPNAVAVGADGAIYVGGIFNFFGNRETYLARVNSTNGSLLWLRTENFNDTIAVDDEINSLSIDSAGTVFAGGSTQNPATGFVGALLSYSPNGTLLISETYPAVEQQRILSTTVNAFDEVFVGLRTFNNLTATFNARLLRISPQNGSIIWQRAESVGDAQPNFLIASDPNGLIYFAEGAEILGGDNTWSVGLYDRDGQRIFENALDAIAPLSISSIAASEDGSLLIAGAFNGQAQFGNQFPDSGANSDTFLTRLTQTAELDSGELIFESETYSSFESNSTLEVTILRQGGVDGEVSVEVDTQEGVALVGDDFTAIQGQTITFLPGQRSESFNLTIINDFIPEGSETLTMQLSNPQGGASLGSIAQASVLILNDDFAFEQFLADFFTQEELANNLIAGEEADPDGDGFDNLTEYAFGLNPREASSALQIEITSIDNSVAEIVYRRSDGDDLDFTVENSSDLQIWTTVGTISETLTPIAEGIETAEITVPADSERRFYRLLATRADLGIGSVSE